MARSRVASQTTQRTLVAPLASVANRWNAECYISIRTVRLTLTLRPAARRAQELVDAFRFLIAHTRFEPGCLGCSVWPEPDLSVRYVEEWASEEDIRRRVASDRFTSVLSLIESVREPPQVQFDFVSRTRGLDYVAEVRHLHAEGDRGGPFDR